AGQALEPDHAPREVDQDRGQGSQPLEVRDVSTGGSRRATEVVRPDFGPDRPAATGMRLGLRFTTPDKPVRTSPPGVRGAPGGAISDNARRKSAGCGGLREHPNAGWRPPRREIVEMGPSRK